MTRRPIVGVMGSGTVAHSTQSAEIGRWLARQGVHLLTGGGGGTMAAVSRAFYETRARRGLVLAVIPSDSGGPPTMAKPGYPNRWVEICIRTHLPLSGSQGTDLRSRNHINVLSSDILIFLPGGAGTRSEMDLAIAYGRPAVAYAPARFTRAVPDSIARVDSFQELQRVVRQMLSALPPGR
jgi:uncharacterized protein (TIGR00725 family)